LVEDDPEGPDGTLQDRGESDVENVAFFFKELAAFFGFSEAFSREVHVIPAGEPVLFIPDTFSVTDQNEFIHKSIP
jgi:hypothetical protein